MSTTSTMPSYRDTLSQSELAESHRLSHVAEGSASVTGMFRLLDVVLLGPCGGGLHAVRAGLERSHRARRRGARELADVLGQLLGPALQSASPDRRVEREEPGVQVDAPEPGLRLLGELAARRRRHHVSDAAAERRDGRRCAHGPHLLDVQARGADRLQDLLRREQPRPGDSRPHARSWARSTRTSWRSTHATAACCGTRPSPRSRTATR